jgi:hypothetical protein
MAALFPGDMVLSVCTLCVCCAFCRTHLYVQNTTSIKQLMDILMHRDPFVKQLLDKF